MSNIQALLGIVILIGVAWSCSSQRKSLNLKLVSVGIGLQFLLAFLLLKVSLLQGALIVLNQGFIALESATQAGTSLVFGYLGGGDTPFEVSKPQHAFVLALRSLPIVIVFSALSALLWYWRITPLIIQGFAKLLRRSFGIGGALGLGSASSVFVGMVESPLLVRPYIAKMCQGELFVLMTCGMATVAGTVMGLYASFLASTIDNALSHIIIASVISVPAAITLALVMRPISDSTVIDDPGISKDRRYSSSMHALTQGTQDGLQLFLNITAMLIVFVALVSLLDQLLLAISPEDHPLSLIILGGYAMQPLVWLIGIPWEETAVAGQLMASKVILNELITFLKFSALPSDALSDKSKIIMSYALCGFANFGSLGIMIGGLTAICPERSKEIVKLAPLSILSGVLATSMTGAVVGIVLSPG
ncbi:MAG TPA: nucleoside:proton symporter [Porticoccus sp.]|nr:nucleoside:proton symporter [Porticoccus sp.]